MLDFSRQSGLVNVSYEDEKRRLWIGTDYGLFIHENNFITRFTDANSTQLGSVQAITELENGTLYLPQRIRELPFYQPLEL